MSTYKVIQDIEAEDKLVGPLTLRQFIYAGIAAVSLYLCFVSFSKHATFLLVFFLPIAAVTGFFAFPWKGEQPTEIWALARLRFMIKPRIRVWDQSNVQELVTVLAPRKLEIHRPKTNNLSENEVRSRLRALADTIDSRGWATRNARFGFEPALYPAQAVAPGQAVLGNLNADQDMFDEQGSVAQNLDAMLAKSSQDQRQRVMQRMVEVQLPPSQAMPTQPMQAPPAYVPPMPQQVSSYSVPQLPAPIMPTLPPVVTPAAAAPAYQQPTAPAYQPAAPANDYWFANGPTFPNNPAPSPIIAAPAIPESYADAVASGKIMTDVPVAAAATPTADENAFAQIAKEQSLAAQQINYSHMKVLQPVSGKPPAQAPSIPGMIDYGRPQPTDDQMQYDTSLPQPGAGDQATANAVTRPADPAIINVVNQLANNDDLDVATIARQVKKEIKQSPDEVEIRLH